MSAIALIVTDDYVVMAGDGVASDPATGAVVAYMSKLSLMPELNAVMAITGIGGFDHLLGWFMPCGVKDFDDLVEVLPDLVKRCHFHAVAQGMIVGGDHRTNVTVAGWSGQREQFEGWRVVSYEKETIDEGSGRTTVLPPWTLLPMPRDRIWCSTAPASMIKARFGLPFATDDDNDVDMLVRMICAARAESGDIAGLAARFNAGAFVQIALVDRRLCQSWIAHRWPEDVIGKPIDPTLGEPMPKYLMDRDREQT